MEIGLETVHLYPERGQVAQRHSTSLGRTVDRLAIYVVKHDNFYIALQNIDHNPNPSALFASLVSSGAQPTYPLNFVSSVSP